MTTNDRRNPGHNTTIRHGSTVWHVQTEDHGPTKPQVVTHLFVDGGRIVASRRTDYASIVDHTGSRSWIRNLVTAQHQRMLVDLRRGRYDEYAEDDAAHVSEAPFDLELAARLEVAAPARKPHRATPEGPMPIEPTVRVPPGAEASDPTDRGLSDIVPEDRTIHDTILADVTDDLEER